jgi:hypothetical protein
MINNNYHNFGFILLALLYLFYAIGSFISSAILKSIGIKACFVLGGIGHLLFILA